MKYKCTLNGTSICIDRVQTQISRKHFYWTLNAFQSPCSPIEPLQEYGLSSFAVRLNCSTRNEWDEKSLARRVSAYSETWKWICAICVISSGDEKIKASRSPRISHCLHKHQTDYFNRSGCTGSYKSITHNNQSKYGKVKQSLVQNYFQLHIIGKKQLSWMLRLSVFLIWMN